MSKGGGKNGRSVSYFRFDTLVAISLQMEPVTRVTSERTPYNELKIEEREREREKERECGNRNPQNSQE